MVDFEARAAPLWANRELLESRRGKFLAQTGSQLWDVDPADPRRLLFLARAMALGGWVDDALTACAGFLRSWRAALAENRELRNTLAEICFLTRTYDPLVAFIRERYQAEIEITAARDGVPSEHVALWTLRGQKLSFLFSDRVIDHQFMDVILKHWIQVMPALCRYAARPELPRGAVFINLGDVGTVPGLAYCDYRPGFFLIPDPIFLQTDAYAFERSLCRDRGLPWPQRKTVAFWRGQSTGWTDCYGNPPASWRDLPRVRLCEIARSARDPERFDVALSGTTQLAEPAAGELRQSGLIGDYVPFEQFLNCKYQIDIDGNTSAWPGLFTKLCTGNPVLKVKSAQDYRQWYYDRLVPWRNYVPVEADMRDLVEKVDWLVNNDDEAQRIGEQGRALAAEMTAADEIARALPTIAAAFGAASGGG